MQFMRFFAEKDDQNRRLDRVLRKFLLQHPLPLLYKSIRNGFIRVNDKKTSADYRVQSGDCIAIEQYLYQNGAKSKKLQTPTDGVYNALCAPVLQDVFKNEHIRIINKPYGIPVHGAHGCYPRSPAPPRPQNNRFACIFTKFKRGAMVFASS